jgi:anion-transporting  ArsA/GET3 family ATPase
MDVSTFCRQSRVLVIAGKGGVGKTTITAAMARMAAGAGLSVLIVDLEGKPGMSTAFGGSGSLGYDESVLSGVGAGGGSVRARRITPDDALLEYLADHGMRRISKRLVSSGALDVVATAIPGIRDILVLGKVKQLERERMADLILVDAPATGHAMTFLSSARGLLDAARSGPVRTQAADVVEFLSDPARCQVALVTLPEEMPVTEVVEAAYQLEDKVGITLGPVVVNACLPDAPLLDEDPVAAAAAVGVTLTADQAGALAAAAQFRSRRFRLQEEQRRRLAEELPLPQLPAPLLFGRDIGPDELTRIADDLTAGVLRLGSEDRRADRAGPDGHDDAGSEDAGTDNVGSEDVGSEDVGSEDVGTDDAGADGAGGAG